MERTSTIVIGISANSTALVLRRALKETYISRFIVDRIYVHIQIVYSLNLVSNHHQNLQDIVNKHIHPKSALKAEFSALK